MGLGHPPRFSEHDAITRVAAGIPHSLLAQAVHSLVPSIGDNNLREGAQSLSTVRIKKVKFVLQMQHVLTCFQLLLRVRQVETLTYIQLHPIAQTTSHTSPLQPSSRDSLVGIQHHTLILSAPNIVQSLLEVLSAALHRCRLLLITSQVRVNELN